MAVLELDLVSGLNYRLGLKSLAQGLAEGVEMKSLMAQGLELKSLMAQSMDYRLEVKSLADPLADPLADRLKLEG